MRHQTTLNTVQSAPFSQQNLQHCLIQDDIIQSWTWDMAKKDYLLSPIPVTERHDQHYTKYIFIVLNKSILGPFTTVHKCMLKEMFKYPKSYKDEQE